MMPKKETRQNRVKCDRLALAYFFSSLQISSAIRLIISL